MSDSIDIAGKRVLLAEDEEVTRTVVAKVLRAMGLDVVETRDGGRMLVAVTSQYKDGHSPADIDLVITDVQMPVVGGLDILQGMRAAGWMTPAIVMTGYETPRVREVADRLGAILLTKPLDLDAFERVVRRLLETPRPARSSAAMRAVVEPLR
jgi:two-component system chemotaxis response regulator CheY